MNLSTLIKKRMRDLLIDQHQLAKSVGVTQPAIHKLLTGKTQRTKKIPELSRAIEVSSDVILSAIDGDLTEEQLSSFLSKKNYHLPDKTFCSKEQHNNICKRYSQLDGLWKKQIDTLIQIGIDAQAPKTNLTLYQKCTKQVLIALMDKGGTADEIMAHSDALYQELIKNKTLDHSNIVQLDQFAQQWIKKETA